MEKIIKRRAIYLPFFISVVGILVIYLLLKQLEPIIVNNNYIPGFLEFLERGKRGEFFGRLQWFISDITEATFHGAVLPAITVLIGGVIANKLEKKGKVFLDIKILGGSGLFWPVLLTSLVSLLITNVLYFDGVWSPTFTPYISIAPILIQVFGYDFKRVITIIVASIFNYPLANLIYEKVALPLKVPGFSGVVIGMAIMVIVATEICNLLPWMTNKTKKEEKKEKHEEKSKLIVEETKNENVKPKSDFKFFFGRLLTDPGEAYNWGTPVSVIALYLGCIISWILNPDSVSYASGRFPILFLGGFLTCALAIFTWYPRYKKEGFAFTFTSVICANSVFNTYDLSFIGVVSTILVSAVAVPLIVHFILDKFEITKRWHPAPVAQIVLGVVSMIWSLIVMNISILMI